MKVYIKRDGKQEAVEASTVQVGNTTLEQMYVKIQKLEKDMNKLIEEKKQETEQTKAFFLKRL
jgi:hypothetical protein